jgi:hypothetical protein
MAAKRKQRKQSRTEAAVEEEEQEEVTYMSMEDRDSTGGYPKCSMRIKPVRHAAISCTGTLTYKIIIEEEANSRCQAAECSDATTELTDEQRRTMQGGDDRG